MRAVTLDAKDFQCVRGAVPNENEQVTNRPLTRPIRDRGSKSVCVPLFTVTGSTRDIRLPRRDFDFHATDLDNDLS